MNRIGTAPAFTAPEPSSDLEHRYTTGEGSVVITGVHAIVRAAMDQMRADRAKGLRTATFVSGYPGSPLAGLDKELLLRRSLLEALEIRHQPGLNEELAATSVTGSQLAGKKLHLRYDGVVGMWYGKAPGLDRASDAIRHANYTGTPRHSGALAWVGDDPACKSSTIPSSSEHLLADMFSPILVPGSVQEVLDLALHGVALSRASSLWTGMKLVTAIADGMAAIEVGPSRVQPVVPVDDDGQPRGIDTTIDISFAARIAAEGEIHRTRLPTALEYARLNRLNEVVVDPPSAWLGIIAPSHTHYELVGALHKLGLDLSDLHTAGVRLLRVGMLFPFDDDAVRSFARGLDEVLVVEERRPFLEPAVRNALYGTTGAPRVGGKHDDAGQPLVPATGALDTNALLAPIRARLATRIADRLAPLRAAAPLRAPIVIRAPYFCSGCPHSTGTKVPAGTMVGSGIGCHGMIGWMDPDRVGTVTSFTQMGGEGAQFIGIAPFVDEQRFTQNVGDGTYFHSGQLAIQAAVAAGVDMTFKILFNDTVAMTGGQDAQGRLSPATLSAILLAQGVGRVIITTEDLDRYRQVAVPSGVDVWDRGRIIEAQEELNRISGVTVLIHDQRCAAEARRLRKRGMLPDPPQRIAIIQRVCEGCGDCGAKSNCMAVPPIDTEFGTKRTIDQTSCNKDYSCLQGDCPSFVSVTPMAQGRLRGLLRRRPPAALTPRSAVAIRPGPVQNDELTEPVAVVDVDGFSIRMPGVGGTGVLTVSQILVTAASMSGLHTTSMDQTGLAQKGGPVVSDVRISRGPVEEGAKIPNGSASLYLVCDAVVGAFPVNLAAVGHGRTLVVVSTTDIPTGDQVSSRGAIIRDQSLLLAEIRTAAGDDRVHEVDAGALAHELLGTTTVANVLLLGIAYQLGAVPVPASAIEQAIELNGAAVAANLQAFRWGRRWVLDREAVESRLPVRGESASTLGAELVAPFAAWPELAQMVALRANDLVLFQNRKLADQYVAFVHEVLDTEQAVVPGSTVVTRTVARYLYKLMAYKDEYEVARLHLEAAAEAEIAAVANGQTARIEWLLHPPVLRAIGMKRKVRLRRTAKPAFRALRAARGVRGTPLDVFGYTRVRRVERALVSEYRKAVTRALCQMRPDTVDAVVAIAALPDIVRGYEEIKLTAVERYRTDLEAALVALERAPVAAAS